MTKRLLHGILLSAAIAGCGAPTEPFDTLRLDLLLAPTTVVLGDTVWVTVRAQNTGGDTVTVESGGSGCLLGFEVFDGAGSQVFTVFCPQDVLEMHRLAPGEVRVRRLPWVGERSPWLGPPTIVPRGQYRVEGVLVARNPVRRTDSALVTLLASGR